MPNRRRILVADALGEAGLEVLREAKDVELSYEPGLREPELAQRVPGFDALIVRSSARVTERVLAAGEALRVVGRAGSGVDNIDVAAATRRGVVVMNTPAGSAVTTAEHAIALLLALARKIPQATASMRAGQWERPRLQGRELTGKTLGVIGLGNIGRVVIDRARGLRMRVVAFDPLVTSERAGELGVELVTLPQLFARADAITVHTPLTTETRALVDDRAIAQMKPGVLLVNCARGGIYDEAALLRGLESGRIGGVALDVFEEEPPGRSPLLAREDVICTPHLGASTDEADERVAVEIAEQVVAYLASGTVTHAVNAPPVPRELAPRLVPWVDLARRLGLFLSQTDSLQPRAIGVEHAGEPDDLAAAPIAAAAIAGVLERFLGTAVNGVSAPSIARERGIAVRETRVAASAGYTALVSVTIEGVDGRVATAAGALAADGGARLVRWNGFAVDAHLHGATLITLTEDRPGVIGAVGTVLGRARVNVSRMQVGLLPGTRSSAALWCLDEPVPAGVLDEIRALPDVASALAVTLP